MAGIVKERMIELGYGPKAIDLHGRKVGLLTVIKPVGYKGSTVLWECRCDCGGSTHVKSTVLNKNRVKSCGCKNNGGHNKLPKGESSKNHLYAKYKCVSERRGISFELTKEDFKYLISCSCYYCGCKPIQSSHVSSLNGSYLYNGVDRVDNNKGYTLNNCVTACGFCNKAKNNLSLEEFYEKIKAIAINKRLI